MTGAYPGQASLGRAPRTPVDRSRANAPTRPLLAAHRHLLTAPRTPRDRYARSGWCFAETCWAALTTNFERSLDLGKFTGTKTRLHGNHGVLAECATGARRPPLLPEQFAHELSSKTFYNRDHDLPLVSDLYAKVPRRRVAVAIPTRTRRRCTHAHKRSRSALLHPLPPLTLPLPRSNPAPPSAHHAPTNPPTRACACAALRRSSTSSSSTRTTSTCGGCSGTTTRRRSWRGWWAAARCPTCAASTSRGTRSATRAPRSSPTPSRRCVVCPSSPLPPVASPGVGSAPPPRRLSRPPSGGSAPRSLWWLSPSPPLPPPGPAQVLPPLEKLEYRGNDQMGEPGLQALRRASCGL